MCERKNSADTKVGKEGGGGGFPVAGADSPAARGEDNGEAGCPPAACGGHGGAHIHLQPAEDPTPEQVDALEGGCDPVESLR